MLGKNSAKGARRTALNELCRVAFPYYQESHRHYHTFTHISQLLNGYHTSSVVKKALQERGLYPYEELAIIFHDIVYVPGSQFNEHMSIQLMRTLLHRHAKWTKAFAGEEIALAEQCIIDTIYPHKPKNEFTSYMVDLDMLGFSWSYTVFCLSDRRIDREFAAVPNVHEGRKNFLATLLNERRPFYYTPELQALNVEDRAGFMLGLEDIARTNIARLLKEKFDYEVSE